MKEQTSSPVREVFDLDRGESAAVAFAGQDPVQLQLLDVVETTDALRGAIVAARVKVRVDAQEVWLSVANYALPMTVGPVQVDCPITKGYLEKSDENGWALLKEARLRVWPAGGPWLEPGSYLYPAKQRWFASMTQMANEPTYVDISSRLPRASIYYHDQLDIGGAEGRAEVISATAGTVIVKGEAAREDIAEFGYRPRYDRVAVLDGRGWLHVYSHLNLIAPGVAVGASVCPGDPIGLLGKEGSSGGWAHLHYGIFARQPSGQWGTEEGYAYLLEAYRRQADPALLAVARPHHLTSRGEPVMLDGARSWSRDGTLTYHWTLSDGTTAEGPQVPRRYAKPGVYSETLCIRDDTGHVDYDFAVVQVCDPAQGLMPPAVHAAYTPTLGLQPGAPITFLARVFNSEDGTVEWDFGDGSEPVTVTSNPVKPEGRDALAADGYAAIVYRYAKAGHYLVRAVHVEGESTATAGLHVRIGQE